MRCYMGLLTHTNKLHVHNLYDGAIMLKVHSNLLPILLIIFVCLISCGRSDESIDTNQEKIKSHLIKLENQMMQAVMDRDSVAMDSLIGEDFLLTSSESNGFLMPKQQYVTGSMNSEVLQVDLFRFYDFRVRVFPDRNTAIVHNRIDWKSTYRGKRWDADFLMTDVWMKRGGKWKIVARHSSYPREYFYR